MMNDKIRAILVDDEVKVRHVLRIKIEKYCPQIEITGEAENIIDAEIMIRENGPQLIFLDIQMPGGSGFDLLRSIEDLNFEVIFTTGFDEFAIKAIKANAIGYLLKPIRTDELIEAVNKAVHHLSSSSGNKNLSALLHDLQMREKQKSRIGIPTQDGIEFYKISDIIRCEGWQKYTKVVVSDIGTVISSYNLGEFNKLLDPCGFISVHKSHLVNFMHINKYLREGTVILSDGSSVPVSKRKKSAFLEQMNKI